MEEDLLYLCQANYLDLFCTVKDWESLPPFPYTSLISTPTSALADERQAMSGAITPPSELSNLHTQCFHQQEAKLQTSCLPLAGVNSQLTVGSHSSLHVSNLASGLPLLQPTATAALPRLLRRLRQATNSPAPSPAPGWASTKRPVMTRRSSSFMVELAERLKLELRNVGRPRGNSSLQGAYSILSLSICKKKHKQYIATEVVVVQQCAGRGHSIIRW